MCSSNRNKESNVVRITPAGPDHQVISFTSGSAAYRRTPCSDCPWRVDATGIFPPEAFVASAATSYDIPDVIRLGLAPSKFSCHQSGSERPATCAGFLLRGATHNLAVRLSDIDVQTVQDGGVELHPHYRAMAVANGVPADHPALAHCRDD